MLNQRGCLPYGKIPQIPAILNSPPGLPSRQVGFARGRPRFTPLTVQRYSALSVPFPISSYPSPVDTYLFLFALEYGKVIMRAKPFGKDGDSSRFFRPSLDAPRTHQPINHSADKRCDWVRISPLRLRISVTKIT